MAAPKKVAKWMLRELEKNGVLYREAALSGISTIFGEQIDKKIIGAFKQLTEGIVVWVPRGRLWRMRKESDPPGRRQDAY